MDDLFFILSKLLWVGVRPETWFGLLLLAAILAFSLKRWRLGMGFLIAELTFFVSLAVFPLGDLLLAPLEGRFPVRTELPIPAYVVVLGGAEDNEQSAATGMVNINSAGERLLAAIALAVAYPDAKLILSGGSGRVTGTTLSSAQIMANALTAAGIQRSRLLLEHESRNTAENGSRSTELAGVEATSDPMVLVTSAFHMSRSLGVFCAAGWSDITPYPVDHRSGNFGNRIGWDFAANLEALNLGVREWIGLLAYRLTGRTNQILPRTCNT